LSLVYVTAVFVYTLIAKPIWAGPTTVLFDSAQVRIKK